MIFIVPTLLCFNTSVKRLRKEGPRKPLSLTERLRQEFGLEESEEEDHGK